MFVSYLILKFCAQMKRQCRFNYFKPLFIRKEMVIPSADGETKHFITLMLVDIIFFFYLLKNRDSLAQN